VLLLWASPVCASDAGEVRSAAVQYAKAGEVILAEGPFYLEGREYWIADFVKKAEVQASIVYDAESRTLVKNRDTMRKVFGTRAMKNATQSDPLFYAVGEPWKIVNAAPYEMQNVRNFAAFVPITAEEQAQLETFLQSYRTLVEGVAQSIEVTDAILNPKVEIRMDYSEYPPKVDIKPRQGGEEHFSYEGFRGLLETYDGLMEGYWVLTEQLEAFVGDTSTIPTGTVIRQKWGIKVTKESILEEVALARKNGEALQGELDYRRELLEGEHREEVRKAEDRLGVTQMFRIKLGIIAALVLAAAFLRLSRRKRGKAAAVAAIVLFTAATLPVAVPQEVPSVWDIMEGQITSTAEVDIEVLATGINESTVRQIIRYYPMILEGEDVKVLGPYYEEGQGYYIFDIVDGGMPTGNLIVVEYPSMHMTGSYRIVGRLMKTYLFRNLILEEPLYAEIDADKIGEAAIANDDSTLAVYLARLAVNVREGQALEENLSAVPEFNTARELARHYRQAHVIIGKMAQLVPERELDSLSQGLSKETDLLEAYYLIMKYTITDDYPLVAASRYRGRALNRIPMMQELAAYQMAPSKLQLVHDMSTDLFYGNDFCWRLGKLEPPLFVSLPRQRGGPGVLEE